MNRLDKIISWFSPEAGLRRTRARMIQDVVRENQASRKYEGASMGRRTEGWRTTGSSANAEVINSLDMLRARHRALVRDNPYAASAVRVIAHNMIGGGLTPHFKGVSNQQTQRLESLAVDHLDTTAIDADGMHDLYGLQNLWAKTVAESGSVLVRRRSRRSSDGLPLPFQLQTLEPDFLDRTRDGPLRNGGRIVGGKEYDPLGRLAAFWLYPEHPGEVLRLRGFTSSRVDAANVAHIYRVDRPGQVDGVPWGAPVIIRLRDFDEYEDAQLMRQKIAAAFAVFVVDNEFAPQQMTGPDGVKSDNPLVDKIEPAMIEYIGQGRDVKFAAPPGVDGYSEYSSVNLHAVAAGYGIPFEALAMNYSEVNFSSGRMGWLEFQRNLDAWRLQMMIPMGCQRVAAWFLETAEISGTRTAGASVKWGVPRREMIDPTKEVKAIKDKIRSGQTTISGMLRAEGVDPRRHLEEYRDDMLLLDDLGLTLDSDPRKTTGNGSSVSTSQDTTNETTDPQEDS